MKEAILRDMLAANPALLESSLRLAQKEYFLPDEARSSGFVDLLCHDDFGTVIVELKTTRGPTRTTLNEVLKYVSLYQSQSRLPVERLRVIVASVHWEDLMLAFSLAARELPFQIDGYRVHLDADDRLVGFSKLPPLPLEQHARFGHAQILVYCESNERREQAIKDISGALHQGPLPDHVTILLDDPSADSDSEWPCALYFAVPDLTEEDRSEPRLASILQRRAAEIQDKKCASCYVDLVLWDTIGSFTADGLWFEIGTHAKLASLLTKWTVRSISRRGFVENLVAYPDEYLLDALQGNTGESKWQTSSLISPRNRKRWDSESKRLAKFGRSVPAWRRILLNTLERFESCPNATVDVFIFLPDCLPWQCYYRWVGANPTGTNTLPGMTIEVTVPDEPPIRIEGYLKWDGRALDFNAEDATLSQIRDVPRNWDRFFMLRFQEKYGEYNDAFCKALGITYEAFEARLTERGYVLVSLIGVHDRKLKRYLVPRRPLTVDDIAEQDSTFIKTFTEAISKRSVLVDDPTGKAMTVLGGMP